MQQRLESLGIGRPAKRQRARHSRLRTRARGEDDGAVRNPLAARKLRDVPVDVERAQLSGREPGGCGASEIGEFPVIARPPAERLERRT